MPISIPFLVLLLSCLFVNHANASAVIEKQRLRKQQNQQSEGNLNVSEGIPSSGGIFKQTQAQPQAQASPKATLRPKPVESETLILADIWREFEVTSSMWPEILDRDAKILTVRKYIEWFRNQEVIISKPPTHYVGMINNLADDNPGVLNQPFKEVVMFVAIIEYDFENGVDKDDLAKKILSPAVFEQNKKRLGLR